MVTVGPAPVRRRVSGWGRAASTVAVVARPQRVDDIVSAIARDHRSVLARGLGRSYGDAAQSAGGILLDLSRFDDIALDDTTGCVVAGAGVTLDALIRLALPRGWFLPVTPGTRFVTVGGAIAADIHGKNHHVDGSLGRYLRWVDIIDGCGRMRRLTPQAPDPVAVDDFWATVGGLGLTGVIIRAAFTMRRVNTAWMRVDTERASDLATLMVRLRALDPSHRYSVAWVDTLSGGRRRGRGVISSGDHADPADLSEVGSSDPATDPLRFAPQSWLIAPALPISLVARPTVRVFNEAWFRHSPRSETAAVQRIDRFFHPLDGIREWNRLYGPRGLVQYQFVVPDHRDDVVETAIGILQAAGAAPFLAVLKRLGEANPAPLSFPRPGWTLALDLPITDAERLARALDHLDGQVADAGGAVYLVKDARCRPDLVEVMYPQLPRWRAARQRLDPDRRFRSDLSRRLTL